MLSPKRPHVAAILPDSTFPLLAAPQTTQAHAPARLTGLSWAEAALKKVIPFPEDPFTAAAKSTLQKQNSRVLPY